MDIVWFNVNSPASTDGCEDWDENLKIPYNSITGKCPGYSQVGENGLRIKETNYCQRKQQC